MKYVLGVEHKLTLASWTNVDETCLTITYKVTNCISTVRISRTVVEVLRTFIDIWNKKRSIIWIWLHLQDCKYDHLKITRNYKMWQTCMYMCIFNCMILNYRTNLTGINWRDFPITTEMLTSPIYSAGPQQNSSYDKFISLYICTDTFIYSFI